jgi:hypothetical protein
MQTMNLSKITDALVILDACEGAFKGAFKGACKDSDSGDPHGENPHVKTYDPKAADAWACAVLMFVMCFACPPFEDTAPSKCRYFACLVQKNYKAFWNGHLCNFKNCNSTKISNGYVRVLQTTELQALFQTLFAVDPLKRMDPAAMKCAVDATVRLLYHDNDQTLSQAQVFDIMTERTQVRNKAKQHTM